MLSLLHDQARPRARSRNSPSSAAYQRIDFCARPAESIDHADLLSRRAAQRGRSSAEHGRARAPLDAGRANRESRAGGSSAIRHRAAGGERDGVLRRMSIHPADSQIFGALYGTGEIRALFSDEAHLQFMLDVEAALARAESQLGLVPPQVAEAIVRAARVENLRLDYIAE